MLPKENKKKNNTYFHLSPEDRMEFELENKEKKEKESAVEKILQKREKEKN